MYHEKNGVTTRRGCAAAALMFLLTTGCSQSSAPPKSTEPANPNVVQAQPAQTVLPDGFAVDLELAITPQEVANGLMFRPSLPENRGMLFVFEGDRIPSFWMKNTLISLDLVFLDMAGTVVDVVPNVPPCAADPCPTYSPKTPARAVLEVVAGAAAAHDIDTGVVLPFARIPGYPIEVTATPDAASDS